MKKTPPTTEKATGRPATPGADQGKRLAWTHFAAVVAIGLLAVVPMFYISPSPAPASLDWRAPVPKPEVTAGRIVSAPPTEAGPPPAAKPGNALAAAFDPLIVAAADRHSVDTNLVRAIVTVESGFKKRAVGPKGALGLMQLMPHTARSLGVKNAFDPADNIDAGVKYICELLDRYDGNVRLALAAYNAGIGRVAQYGGVPPFPTTKAFIQKVLYHQGRYQAMQQATPHRMVNLF